MDISYHIYEIYRNLAIDTVERLTTTYLERRDARPQLINSSYYVYLTTGIGLGKVLIRSCNAARLIGRWRFTLIGSLRGIDRLDALAL